MSNNISTAAVFQKELDKQILELSTSGWMEENAGQVIYNGGKEIKIPKIAMQGLGTYDREEGYTGGAVTFSYQTHTMSQDRGRRFRLDAMDVDETDFALTAAAVASEFQRTQVIPEIDAYRYSTLAKKAGNKEVYTPAKSSVFSTLMEQIGKITDVTGGEGELVVIIARPVYDMLLMSSEVQKILDTTEFTQGGLNFTVKSINNIPLIPVSSARMKEDYIFKTGGEGEEEGGFKAKEGARNINWIICPRKAPVAISKTDNIKIIPPEQNQFADAWDIDYRKYHDLFLPENAAQAVTACFDGSSGL